uniref:Uncharacterized protein n=1 Tax=Timema genevievae TaxID=629358 RepID=A0A7R9JPX1_TIMGE|nr:unnamed protein product [Timema genevievae]
MSTKAKKTLVEKGIMIDQLQLQSFSKIAGRIMDEVEIVPALKEEFHEPGLGKYTASPSQHHQLFPACGRGYRNSFGWGRGEEGRTKAKVNLWSPQKIKDGGSLCGAPYHLFDRLTTDSNSFQLVQFTPVDIIMGRAEEISQTSTLVFFVNGKKISEVQDLTGQIAHT